MHKKKLGILLVMSLTMLGTACSGKQAKVDNTIKHEAAIDKAEDKKVNHDTEDDKNKDDSDNSPIESTAATNSTGSSTTKNLEDPFAKDLLFLKSEFPKKHVNPFTKISQEEFNTEIDETIAGLDHLNEEERAVALAKIIASIGDGHSKADIWDGYHYPLHFELFGDDVYIVDADRSLKEMIDTKVTAIDGVDIKTVIDKLTKLIAHENDSWVLSNLATMIGQPVFLYGSDIVKDEFKATFTVESNEGKKDYSVTPLSFEECADFVNQKKNSSLLWDGKTNYTYDYMKDSKALYFQYNVCDNAPDQSFKEFNQQLFDTMNTNEVERIILDLRYNSGGDNQILNPFLDRIPKYIKKHPNVKMYILFGRNTFSSGLDSIFMVKDVVPDAVLVGEPTGEPVDSFGEKLDFRLPNTNTPITYSTKFYENSKAFQYKNKGVDSCVPDVNITPTIEDYKDGKDPVLEYALKN